MDILEQKRAEALAKLAPTQEQVDALAESLLSQSHAEAAQALSSAQIEFDRMQSAVLALHPVVEAPAQQEEVLG